MQEKGFIAFQLTKMQTGIRYGFLFPLTAMIFSLVVFHGHSWPSDRQAISIHRQLTDRAFSLVESRLSSSFLLSRISVISEYTTGLENDILAHGNNLYRNHGDITALFADFLSNYSVAGREQEAARSFGFCIHLLEDMNVPAHAYNIPHYSPPQRFIDNLEVASWNKNDISGWLISEFDQDAIQISDPATYYYQRAIRSTRDAVQASSLSSYWHEGNGDPWCGGYGIPNCQDGPAGYYSNRYFDLDLFPAVTLPGSQAETLLKDRLNDAVRTVCLFLLASDRILAQNNPHPPHRLWIPFLSRR